MEFGTMRLSGLRLRQLSFNQRPHSRLEQLGRIAAVKQSYAAAQGELTDYSSLTILMDHSICCPQIRNQDVMGRNLFGGLYSLWYCAAAPHYRIVMMEV
jgi:hypothetical protein